MTAGGLKTLPTLSVNFVTQISGLSRFSSKSGYDRWENRRPMKPREAMFLAVPKQGDLYPNKGQQNPPVAR